MRLHYLPGTAAMAPHATLAEIGVAKAKGEGELAALLGSGDTWTIGY